MQPQRPPPAPASSQERQQQEHGGEKQHVATSTKASALSGAIAGGMSRLLTAPFDVVKIRFQLQVGPIANTADRRRLPYTSIWGALRKVAREEGVLGLWRGNLAATYLWIGYGAVQFPVYEWLKDRLAPDGGAAGIFWAGGLAGLVGTVATYPLDVIRTQFATQGIPRVHLTMWSFVQHTVRAQGVLGLFAGLTPTALQIVPRMGLSFSVFAQLEAHGKKALARLLDVDTKASQTEAAAMSWIDEVAHWCLHALSGGLAGGVARTVTHPLDTVKRRMQAQVLVSPHKEAYGHIPRFPHTGACFLHIVRHEGVAALYKGLAPTLLKSGFSSAIIFAFYEALKQKL